MKRNLNFAPTCSLVTFGDNQCLEPSLSTVTVSDGADEVVIINRDASALALPPYKDMQVDVCLMRGDNLDSVACDVLQPIVK